jgi:TM2 domain-containing membrane protein YozV
MQGINSLVSWMNRSQGFILSLIVIIGLGMLPQVANGQKVIKQGKLELEEVNVSPELNGSPIVPPLEPNQGLILFKVEYNDYFDIEDVAQWLKDGRITLQQIRFERSDVSVRPDETIAIKFRYNYLQGQAHVARKVQIKIDAFSTYFSSHRFYKQQVVEYALKVREAPTYDQPLEIKGTLEVETNVDGAEIIVINDEGEQAGSRFVVNKSAQFEIPIGTYQVLARKSGYQDAQIASVQVRKDETVMRTIEMEQEVTASASSTANFSRVTFSTNVDRAVVAVIAEDGTQKQLTAFDKQATTQLAPGEYRVIASLNGFEDYSMNIEVPRDSSFTEEVRLVKTGNLESLEILSQPRGAKVTINGEVKGSTPVTLRDLDRKPYKITLEKENYKTYTEEVDFAIRNSYTLNHELKDSYIRVTTRPSGAKVFIDGEEVGTTPYNQSNPEWKEYTVRVEKELYEPIEETVNLAEVGGFSINQNLEKKVSNVTLASSDSPVPLDITINGQGVTKTFERSPLTEVDLPYGNYDVMIERPGFKSIETSMFVDEQDFNFNYEIEHKKKGVAILLSTLIPGAGQYYWGHSGRGTLTLLVEAAAIGGTVYFLGDYQTKRDGYQEARQTYLNATDQNAINAAAQEMDAAYDDMLTSKDYMLTAISVAAGTYALNILDRLLIKSPSRIIKKANSQTDLEGEADIAEFSLRPTGNGLALRVNF